MENTSKSYSLNGTDLKKIAIGAVVAVAGAGLTYVAQTVSQVDFGSYTPIVVALASILVNTARKYLAGYSN